ncbi:MAG: Sec-independent protein translocase protein TatB [Gammaproteobacteria bacterium]
MFDVGFWELAVIGIVALLVVGPERMPALIRTAGQWAGQVQRLARDLRREIEREAQTDEFRKLNQEFIDEDRRLKESVRAASAPPTAALADATAPVATAPDDAATERAIDDPAAASAPATTADTNPASVAVDAPAGVTHTHDERAERSA